MRAPRRRRARGHHRGTPRLARPRRAPEVEHQPADPGIVEAVARRLASGQTTITTIVQELGRPRNRGLEMAIAAELRRQGATRVRTSRGHVYRVTGTR